MCDYSFSETYSLIMIILTIIMLINLIEPNWMLGWIKISSWLKRGLVIIVYWYVTNFIQWAVVNNIITL